MTSTDHVEFYWFPHTDATLLKSNTRVPLEEGSPAAALAGGVGRRGPRQRRVRRRRRGRTAGAGLVPPGPHVGQGAGREPGPTTRTASS